MQWGNMQLNIKNAQAHRMARELSQLTGESVSQAVTSAIAERLEKERARKRKDRTGLAGRLMAIGEEMTALPLLDERTPDEILYDENGLPKA
ncbi:MAG: type II toxin-antitoxin system VapB family antitoxin [Pseudomonadota bacterium]